MTASNTAINGPFQAKTINVIGSEGIKVTPSKMYAITQTKNPVFSFFCKIRSFLRYRSEKQKRSQILKI